MVIFLQHLFNENLIGKKPYKPTALKPIPRSEPLSPVFARFKIRWLVPNMDSQLGM